MAWQVEMMYHDIDILLPSLTVCFPRVSLGGPHPYKRDEIGLTDQAQARFFGPPNRAAAPNSRW